MSGYVRELRDLCPTFEVAGLACLAIQVTGTRSAGYITIEGSIDGVNYVALPLIEDVGAGSALASGQIIAAGIYRLPVIGLQVCRYVKSGNYSGTLALCVRTDANVPPPIIVGV